MGSHTRLVLILPEISGKGGSGALLWIEVLVLHKVFIFAMERGMVFFVEIDRIGLRVAIECREWTAVIKIEWVAEANARVIQVVILLQP